MADTCYYFLCRQRHENTRRLEGSRAISKRMVWTRGFLTLIVGFSLLLVSQTDVTNLHTVVGTWMLHGREAPVAVEMRTLMKGLITCIHKVTSC